MSGTNNKTRALDRQDMLVLKRSKRDPTDLEKKVREFQAWKAKKDAGKLPMYEVKR